MRVLFVCSGNSGKAGYVVENQASDITEFGIDIDFFLITGKGLIGYFKNILPLKRLLRASKYDVIHAHYSLSAYVASFAGAKPLVVSLMGSDLKGVGFSCWIIKWFNWKYDWKSLIVKSTKMKEKLKIKNVRVIPNGVNINKFQPTNKNASQKKLKWAVEKLHILFAADPLRHEKNFALARTAVNQLTNNELELHVLVDIPPNRVPDYFNASDLIILSSLWEGSPNVIKEAMACNRPVVTTNVDDVNWLFGEETGYYIAGFSTEDFADKIEQALSFCSENINTNGRQRILNLGLNSDSVARRIIDIYISTQQ